MKLNDIQKTILACFDGKDIILKNAEIRDYANESARVVNVEINRLCSRKILQKVRHGEHRLNKEFIK